MNRSVRRSSALALVIASAAILSGCADGGGGYAYGGDVGVDYYQPYGGYYGGWGGGYYVGPGRGGDGGDHHGGGRAPVGGGSHAFHAPAAGRSAPSLPHGGGGGHGGGRR
jgi:hypothetical protein